MRLTVFFNAVCYQPPTVMFSAAIGSASDGMKDSLRNIESSGEFVCNLATWGNPQADGIRLPPP